MDVINLLCYCVWIWSCPDDLSGAKFLPRLELFGVKLRRNGPLDIAALETLLSMIGEIAYGPGIERDDWMDEVRRKYDDN